VYTIPTNTAVSSLQTTDTVLPMLPASAGATAAKILVLLVLLVNDSEYSQSKGAKPIPSPSCIYLVFLARCALAWKNPILGPKVPDRGSPSLARFSPLFWEKRPFLSKKKDKKKMKKKKEKRKEKQKKKKEKRKEKKKEKSRIS
jgi:hypothetical protein